jgi:alpha-tubulin suppressor-like RCC1 family protein
MGGPLFLKMLTPEILSSFVSGISPVKWISCGFEHCIAVTLSGRVVSWGYGASGSLGHANYISYT